MPDGSLCPQQAVGLEPAAAILLQGIPRSGQAVQWLHIAGHGDGRRLAPYCHSQMAGSVAGATQAGFAVDILIKVDDFATQFPHVSCPSPLIFAILSPPAPCTFPILFSCRFSPQMSFYPSRFPYFLPHVCCSYSTRISHSVPLTFPASLNS